MHASTPRVPSPLTILLLLLLCLRVSAQELRDSGYGDNSLVDQKGQYYYPQPDGSFADAYGSTFSPIGEGLYTDPIGNLIDVGPDAVLPSLTDESTPDPGAATDAAPARPRTGKMRAATRRAAGADSSKPQENGDFGSMYLDDVGDGYLAIDPDEIAADPRLADPQGAPVDGVNRAKQRKALGQLDGPPGDTRRESRGGGPASLDADANPDPQGPLPVVRETPGRPRSMGPSRDAHQ